MYVTPPKSLIAVMPACRRDAMRRALAWSRLNTAEPSAKPVPLATATASCSSRTRDSSITGPKVSCCMMSISGVTSASTVGA